MLHVVFYARNENKSCHSTPALAVRVVIIIIILEFWLDNPLNWNIIMRSECIILQYRRLVNVTGAKRCRTYDSFQRNKIHRAIYRHQFSREKLQKISTRIKNTEVHSFLVNCDRPPRGRRHGRFCLLFPTKFWGNRIRKWDIKDGRK